MAPDSAKFSICRGIPEKLSPKMKMFVPAVTQKIMLPLKAALSG
jgi:hypothetical protein